ncbi:MAG: polyprenyl diphosphate synthase [Clostridia bacterium]
MTEDVRRISKELVEYHGEVLHIPHHIAVIPDGNRRWAREHGLPVAAGHKKGVEAYRQLLSNAADLGIRYVTFYAFSTENWKRSKTEVESLMSLLAMQLKNFNKIMGKNKDKIRFIIIGERSKLSASLQKSISKIEEETKANTDLTAFIAINYGGRDEILYGVKKAAQEISAGNMREEELNEALFQRYLYTAGAPDPDLLIRTSGEERISNFLLWQLAYTEFYFDDGWWPDFSMDRLLAAVRAYSKRQRRYGGS